MVISPSVIARVVRFGGMERARWQTRALLLIGVLTALRVVTAIHLPLSFDEAYFWLWSKNLAISYYDHPPLIALAIRLGTLAFGDTEFGVRAVSLGASIVASWAVWRAGAILSGEAVGAAACTAFNLTLMIASQSMAAIPDSLVLAVSAFFLLSIAKLDATGNGRWWIAVGAALGAAFLTKYTAFFLAGGVVLWLFASASARRWLATPWPYVAAAIAIACFIPNLVWNAAHDWVSFRFQFGRVVSGGLTARYLVEFIAGQIALASPFILLLAIIAFARDIRSWLQSKPLSISAAIVLPALVYFTLHATHDRVQGNWPSFIYPALAILAAQTMMAEPATRLTKISRGLAAPVAALILVAVYAQTWTGFLSWGVYDPVARMTAAGISPVAEEISALAKERDAAAIVTTDYVVTGWLCFYLEPHLPVLPVAEDYRYLQAPRAGLALLQKPLLYVTRNPALGLPEITKHFSATRLEKILPRMKAGAVIDKFYVYSLSGFHGAPLGRLPFTTAD